MPRAQRRHDTLRIKARFYRKQQVHACWTTSQRNAGVFANHGKVCSCWMCGNPRKLGEITVQERRANLYSLE